MYQAHQTYNIGTYCICLKSLDEVCPDFKKWCIYNYNLFFCFNKKTYLHFDILLLIYLYLIW